MGNLSGKNQFGNYQLQNPYGDLKRQTELTREAPISGAPMSGRALQAPKRAQRQSQKRSMGAQPVPAPMAPPPAQGQAPASMQAIARVPGASPLVQSLFGG